MHGVGSTNAGHRQSEYQLHSAVHVTAAHGALLHHRSAVVAHAQVPAREEYQVLLAVRANHAEV
jgi:hypothetical protein